jgi:predicted metal-dependent phosphotriesterase family hydrolase
MIQTVLGEISKDELGIVLPHEHILVGFIEDGKMTRDDYDRGEVIRIMLPYLMQLAAEGCRTLTECTPEFLGRDPYLLAELSELSGLHIITNTGYYQKPYLAPFVYETSSEDLARIWIKEALEGIESSGIKPGFIKIALSNTNGGISPVQQTILKAALLTSRETGLPIQAHTIGGETVMHALEFLARDNFEPSRFIWVHADSEPDLTYHKKAALAGMWIEIDSIGYRPFEEHYAMLEKLIGMGLLNRLLISQDAGWYRVGEKNGGNIKPFTTILEGFVPFLREKGIAQSIIEQLMIANPANALENRKDRL